MRAWPAPLLLLAGPAWAGVDVELTSLLPPSPLQVDLTLAYEVGVRNNGTSASAPVSIFLFASTDATLERAADTQLCRKDTPPLAAGAARTETVTCAWPASTVGTYLIAQAVDVQAGLTLDDLPSNNDRTAGPLTPQVPCTYDVQAVGVTLPATAAPGASLPVGWTLRSGSTCAMAGLVTRLALSADGALGAGDLTVCEDTFTLQPGATVTRTPACTLPGSAPEASWTVLVVADVSGAFGETDEGNNVALGSLRVEEVHGADLAPEGPQGTTAAQAGEPIALTVLVRNLGDEPTPPTTLAVRLAPQGGTWDAGTDLCTGTVPPLLDGAATTVAPAGCAVPAGWPTGPAVLRVRADPFDGVVELDETNNTRTVAFEVIDPPPLTGPDLTPHAVRVSSTLAEGTSFQVIYDLANVGTTSTPASRTTLALSQDAVLDGDDVVVCTDDVPGFKVGQLARQVTGCVAPLGTPLGPWRLVVVADVQRVVRELDETDNTVSVAVTLAEAGTPTGPGPGGGPSGGSPGGSDGPDTADTAQPTGSEPDTDLDLTPLDPGHIEPGALGCGCDGTGGAGPGGLLWLALAARPRRRIGAPRP